MVREDGRRNNQLRDVKITRNFIKYAEGSTLIEMGNTRVICTATVEEKVPLFLKGSGSGWITAEYSMLPRSTITRTPRDSVKGAVTGRNYEIQRLIGRCLRAVVDLKALGERTIWIDCDVIQADGGTRTAAITGSVVAIGDCFFYLLNQGLVEKWLLREFLAAVSVGIDGQTGELLLDLSYSEDSQAQVDMNLVMTESGKQVEVQATAEGAPYTRNEMEKLLDLGEKGIKELIAIQKKIMKPTIEKVEEFFLMK